MTKEHASAAESRARLRRAFDVILQAARSEEEVDSDQQGSNDVNNEGPRSFSITTWKRPGVAGGPYTDGLSRVGRSGACQVEASWSDPEGGLG